jgi:hypothetical protein
MCAVKPSSRSLLYQIKVQLWALLQLMTAPAKAAKIIVTGNGWTIAGSLIVVLNSGLHWMQTSALVQQLQRTQALPLTPVQLDVIQRQMLIGVALTPLMDLLKWVILGGLLYLISTVMLAETSYRKLFALVVYSSGILTLKGFFIQVLFKMRGPQSMTIDYQPKIGLDVLVFSSSPALAEILRAINIFDLWYLVSLGAGVAIIHQVSRLKAGLIAGFLWSFQVLVRVMLVSLVSSYRSLMG